ncbi:unnamed protein product [Dibothriocephalus latus]|uniref:RNase NYN domain-containing protein n=1 Tax=Dibothriocephalus latus TaxID=60516 RepID=A0A3P7M8P7_DIBLA|nr:unnamed protein product [Dibothriocephalus latus]
MRPVIIDGANVAHTNMGRKEFSAQNLRLALDYFLRLGHKDICIVLRASRQRALEAVFSEAELKKYFSFTSVRRLDGDRPMVEDDDRLVVVFSSTLPSFFPYIYSQSFHIFHPHHAFLSFHSFPLLPHYFYMVVVIFPLPNSEILAPFIGTAAISSAFRPQPTSWSKFISDNHSVHILNCLQILPR